jgi:hypothetical protein
MMMMIWLVTLLTNKIESCEMMASRFVFPITFFLVLYEAVYKYSRSSFDLFVSLPLEP